jgi:hypothetical protein
MFEDYAHPKRTWIREGAKIMNVISQLEKELKGMKERGAKQEFIDLKDQQINQLVDFYNASEKAVNILTNEIVILKLNVRLTEEIFKRK